MQKKKKLQRNKQPTVAALPKPVPEPIPEQARRTAACGSSDATSRSSGFTQPAKPAKPTPARLCVRSSRGITPSAATGVWIRF